MMFPSPPSSPCIYGGSLISGTMRSTRPPCMVEHSLATLFLSLLLTTLHLHPCQLKNLPEKPCQGTKHRVALALPTLPPLLLLSGSRHRHSPKSPSPPLPNFLRNSKNFGPAWRDLYPVHRYRATTSLYFFSSPPIVPGS